LHCPLCCQLTRQHQEEREISRCTLIGPPFISAFFSKEIILEFILLKNYNPIVYFFIILGVGLTALYSTRFVILVFSFWNLNDLITFKSEEDFFILKRIMTLVLPASLSGSWLTLYLFNNLKLYESLFYLKILVLLLLIIFPLWLLIKSINKVNWNINLWRIRRIWFLPFITTQLFCSNFILPRWMTLKFFDRGTFKFNRDVFKYINSVNKITFSLKLVYKMLFLMIIWLILILIIYTCKL